MNERIKELAEQADKEAFPHGSMAWMEVFAELIVRDCCNIVSDEVPPAYDFDNQHPVIARLKEYFGVE